MSPKFKIILKISGIALSILLFLWLGIAAYVTYNKKVLLKDLTAQLNSNINGRLTIESMEPALVRGFPGVSVSLKNVLLQDSLYHEHRHNLLDAKEVFIALNVFSLIGGNVQIEKLSIDDGRIYLFTDKLGNSNSKIFTEGSNDKDKKNGRKKIKQVEFRNVSFIQENQQKNKLFNFDIHTFSAKLDYNSRGWDGNVRINTRVNSLAFNSTRGSFIKNQLVNANLEMAYTDKTGSLEIPVQTMRIGEESFRIGGSFRSTEKASDFKLRIVAAAVKLKNISALLTRNISSKLAPYNLKKPFYAQALIQGSLKKKGDPRILVSWKVNNDDLTVSGETIKSCSFTGYFDNERLRGNGFNDQNSVIGFAGLKGSYHTIPFRADTVRIINLKRPIFEGRFQSFFSLGKLNSISGSKSFHFYKGAARLDLLYRAPYNKSNSTEPFIFGTLSIGNATLAYHPRNLKFSGISGIFRFKGQDLLIENLRAKSGSSSFVLQASLLNFFNLYYTDPKRIKLDAHIKSPQINLGEFMAFLGKRKSVRHSSAANKSAARIFNQLDKVLDEANVHLDIQANSLLYRRFEANNVHSSILLKQTGIELQDVSFNHADGKMRVRGNINQNGPINRFTISTHINNVNITKLFYSFENFGQDALAYQNLRGIFNSKTNVSGSIRENGQVVPRSFVGSITFSVRNGAILNFEPMEKIGKFAFPNRDFANIRFTNLKNTLDINGNRITIRPMVIESSVLNVSVEGVYGMPTGTDIALRIPLRNPKRDIGLTDSLKRKRFDNGIVINIRAQDDENGNVKFKLGKKDDDEKDIEKEEKSKAKVARKEERRERKDSVNLQQDF